MKRKLIACWFLSFFAFASALQGQCYISVYGGPAVTTSTNLSQSSVAFKPDGPLYVNAMGETDTNTRGLVGILAGFQWRSCNPCFRHYTTAFEVEACYLKNKLEGSLFNFTPRIPGHSFSISVPMNNALFLANTVFSYDEYLLQPYLGGGIGLAKMHISNVFSEQTVPPEPDLNHFSSKTNASSWAFAAQGKVGLSYEFCANFKLFGEYRALYLSPTTYTLGGTDVPGHSATTHWLLDVKSLINNVFIFGITYYN